MNRTSVDLSKQLTKVALGFGGLLFLTPLLCMAFSIFAIPHSIIANTMGLAMLPISTFAALMAWQGFEVDEFLHDAFYVLFLQQGDGLKRLYLLQHLPGIRATAAPLIVIPTFVCATAGFCAALISTMGIGTAVVVYGTLGFIYGLLLFSAIWFWVLPLMVESRRL